MVAAARGPGGAVDVHFLNRDVVRDVRDSANAALLATLAVEPRGYTPIVPRLQRIFGEACAAPTVVLVFTDGEPTDAANAVNVTQLKHCLLHKPPNVTVSFVMCTDDDAVVGIFDDIETYYAGVDVCNDYRSERTQVLRTQGRGFHFSFGEYLVKCLLGSFDAYFDHLDEVHMARGTDPTQYGLRHTTAERTGCACTSL